MKATAQAKRRQRDAPAGGLAHPCPAGRDRQRQRNRASTACPERVCSRPCAGADDRAAPRIHPRLLTIDRSEPRSPPDRQPPPQRDQRAVLRVRADCSAEPRRRLYSAVLVVQRLRLEAPVLLERVRARCPACCGRSRTPRTPRSHARRISSQYLKSLAARSRAATSSPA